MSREMEKKLYSRRERTKKQLNEAVAQLDFRLKTSSSGHSFARQPSAAHIRASREYVSRTTAQSRMKSPVKMSEHSPNKDDPRAFQKSRNSPIKRQT
mmetsp:Transcript_33046/g.50657  ORF Transcript_33046/g.50657 Transcript_33046/m.50657 type:complete len:97 (+) Transcript_33046:1752-2042(+)